MTDEEWIGVDLDGTLAYYDGWHGVGHIGAPIAPMVDRVRKWLQAGENVRIFTARVGDCDEDAMTPIKQWCLQHIGQVLPITCVKDRHMVAIWDDRAVQVEANTGRIVHFDALVRQLGCID